MGIPFYFASLIKSHNGIVQTVKKEVDVLCIDFNCLIHRYLKDDNPVQSVIKALEYILNMCKAKRVILASDGLVPYAKIVQQRYRRMRAKEKAVFDRNQISPGTPYMKSLEQELKKFPVFVSGTSEEGEGEHKIILELKKIPESERKSVCIYGLDADLILICLKHSSLANEMYLLRESGEFNDPSLKHAEFATLSINKLKEQIFDIDQYIALSILCFGNDFMPNLAMFSLREGGYERAMELYNKHKPNLLTEEGRLFFLKQASLIEHQVLKERINLRKRPEEKALIKDMNLFSKKYSLHVLDGVSNIVPVVEAYWKTFHWTLNYFTESTPINWDWAYPYADAPLISDIVLYKESKIEPKELSFTVTDQLQFILPKESLREAKKLVKYTDEIHVETRNPWMKKYDWEMKPRISLPWNPTYSLTKIYPL